MSITGHQYNTANDLDFALKWKEVKFWGNL